MTGSRGIELRGVSVRYGAAAALDGVDLVAPRGEVYVLLGKNGAGKTTLVRTIAGLGLPTSGDAWIGGASVRSPAVHRVRHSMGFLPQDPVLYEDLTGAEFLAFICDLYRIEPAGVERLEERVVRLEMEGRLREPIRVYSAGMRKKIALLASLIPAPRYWILDEPFAALDPPGVRTLEEEVGRLREEGAVVLITAHEPDVAERLADRVGVLDRGRKVFEGTAGALVGWAAR